MAIDFGFGIWAWAFVMNVGLYLSLGNKGKVASGGLCPRSGGGFEPGPKQPQSYGGSDENGDA